MPKEPVTLVRQRLEEAAAIHHRLIDLADDIARVADVWTEALRAGRKILLCGNGGSATDALHLAGELCGRFYRDRPALPALALLGNDATITAIGNDYGFEEVFARQVAAYGRSGDVLVGLSTSGKSRNVVRAMEAAGAAGLVRVAFTGAGGGPVADLAEHCLRAPSGDTPRIQECHILMGHVVCEIAERSLFPRD